MANTQQQPIDINTLSLQHAQTGAHLSPQGSEIAKTFYAGLFTAGTGGYFLLNTLDWNSLVQKWTELLPYQRLVSINTDEEDPSVTGYVGAWIEMKGGYDLLRNTTWTEFITKFTANKSSMRLLDFDIHHSGGSQYFTGTWGSTPIHQVMIHDLGWDSFVAQWESLSGQGMRLSKIQVFPTAGEWHMTGLFEEGSGSYALQMLSDKNAFLKYYEDNQAKMQLVDFQVYDENTTRWYIGVWRETQLEHRFIRDCDWGSFVNQWKTLSGQGLRLQKAVRYATNLELPEPQWDQIFEKALGQSAEGYGYCVMHNGQAVAQGVHYARAAQDAPQKAWTLDTRINLASVSKSITAVAVLKLLADHGLSINDPFYPLVKSQFPTVGPGVDKVTIRNLLSMRSGMKPDDTLYTPNIWTFLTAYLKVQNVPAEWPGHVYAYSNTNFTILQAIIDTVTGHGGQIPDYYPTYVSEKVLTPMGINLAAFNPIPDPQSSATLYYSSESDAKHGLYWPPFDCVAAGGWISSARELAKFLTGVRNNVVLDPTTTRMMLDLNLGWYTYDGIYGQYFHHNGGLLNGATPPQGLATGIIHLADGYDALLLVNSLGADVIKLMINAFETRMV